MEHIQFIGSWGNRIKIEIAAMLAPIFIRYPQARIVLDTGKTSYSPYTAQCWNGGMYKTPQKLEAFAIEALINQVFFCFDMTR